MLFKEEHKKTLSIGAIVVGLVLLAVAYYQHTLSKDETLTQEKRDIAGRMALGLGVVGLLLVLGGGWGMWCCRDKTYSNVQYPNFTSPSQVKETVLQNSVMRDQSI